MAPMVLAVTGLEPQTEPKPAQAQMVAIASAPGRRRIHNSAARNMVAPIPVAASTSPIRTNIGTTTRMKLLDSENAVVASWLSAPGATKIVTPATVTIESATATGVRVAIRISRAIRKTVKLMTALIGQAPAPAAILQCKQR